MNAAVGNSGRGWTLADWEARLSGGAGQSLGLFTEAELAGPAAPVRRYFTQAIAPGAPLAQCIRLSMRGSIKLGRWLPFRAEQILCP